MAKQIDAVTATRKVLEAAEKDLAKEGERLAAAIKAHEEREARATVTDPGDERAFDEDVREVTAARTRVDLLRAREAAAKRRADVARADLAEAERAAKLADQGRIDAQIASREPTMTAAAREFLATFKADLDSLARLAEEGDAIARDLGPEVGGKAARTRRGLAALVGDPIAALQALRARHEV